MPKEIYRILGQIHPVAGVATVLYTVPKLRSAIVHIVAFVNATMSDTVSLAVVPSGNNGTVTAVIENFLVLGLSVDTKQGATGGALNGITLSELDDLVATSTGGDTIFHCYGVELEP